MLHHARRIVVRAALLAIALLPAVARDGVAAPSLLDPGLTVAPVITGLVTPTSIAFLGADDLLVLSKNTGQVRRVQGGVDQGAVLDLAVNFASERGLLGIALHPGFPAPPFAYLYWTVSSTAADTGVLSNVPLLGNRLDRFVWNGATLAFDANLAALRARQTDNVPVPGQPLDTANPGENGNHDGGVVRFGPDGALYLFVGDVGRRGWLQNLPDGPFPNAPFVDDTFGGPAPDNAHLSGVVLRLNADGTAPADNPFFAAGAALGGEAGANLQKVFSYGHRNGFGMAFDPAAGALWLAENGDDSFSELNRVPAGTNGGWTQIMGPASRVAEFKAIETTFGSQALGQVRWPPTRIADTSADALARLFTLPGAAYRDPALSWKWEVAPGGLGFLASAALGIRRQGSLLMGAATSLLEDGYLFRLQLTSDRRGVRAADAALADGVADNVAKHDLTESESLLFGRGFGVVTDIQTGPDGRLFVVSLSQGAIYEIGRAATQTPANENQLRCQRGAAAALAKLVGTKTRCVTKCIAAARKTAGPFDDCFAPFGGGTAACVHDPAKGAEAKARAKIAKACARDCPACWAAGGNCPDGAGFVAEIESQVDANGPLVFCREAAGAAPTKQEASCEDAVSKNLVKLVRTKSRCTSACIAKAFKGTVAVAACEGPAVDDPDTLACIAKTAFKAFAMIDAACAPPGGSVPACHPFTGGGAWVALALSDVDDQTPRTFCGP